jgi:hypothetical protein
MGNSQAAKPAIVELTAVAAAPQVDDSIGAATIRRPYHTCSRCRQGQLPAETKQDIEDTEFKVRRNAGAGRQRVLLSYLYRSPSARLEPGTDQGGHGRQCRLDLEHSVRSSIPAPFRSWISIMPGSISGFSVYPNHETITQR